MKSRRIFLLWLLGASIRWLGACSGPTQTASSLKFYVGSSNTSLARSIFLCEFDPQQGTLSVLDSFSGALGPSYLAFSPDHSRLYSIDDTMADSMVNSMQVTSFMVDRDNDRLTFLNSQPSGGMGPCHVYCDPEGTFLFAANYNSGSVAAFPLDQEGRILPASSVMQSEGSGPVEGRQEGPHTHYVTLDPTGKRLLSPDLGSDRILLFDFDASTGALTPHPEQPFFSLTPGTGPRHLVFHPEGRSLYIAGELNATVTACSFDPEHGVLAALNTLSTVKPSHTGSKYPAAIRISPDGRFVYVSTRGDVSSCITTYRVEADGSLSLVEVVEGVPGWPRDFNIDPSGHYLLAAGERSDFIEVYDLDTNTGRLSDTGITLSLPAPGCILFIPKSEAR
ncbi:MAG: lactonase family protein [Bacteroidales bacterium]